MFSNTLRVESMKPNSEKTVHLFHGTTLSRAHSIKKEGWKPVNLQKEISMVAQGIGIDPAVLHSHLREKRAFVDLDKKRDGNTISFSTSSMHSLSYARRAPEVEWEALWSGFLIANPDDEWGTHEGHWWVLYRQLQDRPVVIVAKVLLKEVLESNDVSQLDFFWFDPQTQLTDPNGKEIELRPDNSIQTLTVVPSDRWVDINLLPYLSGLSREKIWEQVSDGLWGDSIDYRDERVFPWEQVYSGLTAARREVLGLPDRQSWWGPE